MSFSVPTYQLYGDTAGSSDHFWLHCETIPERSRLHAWEIRPHRHDAFFQLLYIWNGHGEAQLDGVARGIAEGDLVFVPPGAVHGFRFSRDIGGLVVTVLRDRLDAAARSDRHLAAFARRPRLVPLAEGDGALAADCLRRISAEMAGPAVGRTAMLDALVAAALVATARASGVRDSAAGRGADRDQVRIERLGTLIGRHFRERREAAFYADALGLSPTHLNRIARAVTGLSLKDLVRRRLIEEARRDLVFTALPAQSIALALGFPDPAYFSRFFRHETGMTPGAYRKAERRRLGNRAEGPQSPPGRAAA